MGKGALVVGRLCPQTEEPTTRGKRGGRPVHPAWWPATLPYRRSTGVLVSKKKDLLSCIVVVGVNTHGCVRTRAIETYKHDYPVYVIRDCVGSYDLEHHEVLLGYIDGRIGTVLSLADFISVSAGWG